jgi:hypothetical protein
MELSGQLNALAALPPGETAPCTYWIGGWVDPRAGLNDVDKRKISCPARNRTPPDPEPVWMLWGKETFVALVGNRTPAVQPLARCYTD